MNSHKAYLQTNYCCRWWCGAAMATMMVVKNQPHHTADVHQVKPAPSTGGERPWKPRGEWGGRSEASSSVWRSHLLDELFQVGGGTCWTAQSVWWDVPNHRGFTCSTSHVTQSILEIIYQDRHVITGTNCNCHHQLFPLSNETKTYSQPHLNSDRNIYMGFNVRERSGSLEHRLEDKVLINECFFF